MDTQKEKAVYTLIAKNHKRTLFLLPLNETLTMKLIPNPYIFAFKLGRQALHPWVGGVDNAPHRNMVFTGNFKFPGIFLSFCNRKKQFLVRNRK